MSIIRIRHRENPFVQIDKSVLSNPKLSWKAKGVLSYLMTLPQDWQLNLCELEQHSRDGREATRNAFAELERNGHVTRERRRLPNGKMHGWIFNIYEVPQPTDGKNTTKQLELINSPTDGKSGATNKYSTNKTIKETMKRDDGLRIHKTWEEKTGSYMTIPRLLKSIKRPVLDHGVEVVDKALIAYLKDKSKEKFQYASPEDFVRTFSKWIEQDITEEIDPTSD